MDKIYDSQGNIIKDGDALMLPVSRCSSSHSTWCQEINKYHGTFWIKGYLKWFDNDLCYKVIMDGKERELLEKPIGKETFNQQVWYVQYDNLRRFILEETLFINSNKEIVKGQLKRLGIK